MSDPRRQAPAARPAGGGMRLCTVRGVPVWISPAAVLFGALVAGIVATAYRNRLPELSSAQAWSLAVLTAFCFLASIVLHEIGHAMISLRFGLRVRSITIHGFAGYTEIEPEPQTALRDALVAVAGPAVNAVLAVGCWVGYRLLDPDSQPGVVLYDLYITNALLFVLNMGPGLPLDGGRVVQAVVWRITGDRWRGVRAAAYAGIVIAGALVVYSSLTGLGSSFTTLLLAAFIGFGAVTALRRGQVAQRLPGLTAGRLARPAVTVPAGTPLAEALRRAHEAGMRAVLVTDRNGEPVAVMSGTAADAVPMARRPWVSIESVSRTLEPALIVDARMDGEGMVSLLQSSPAGEYMVVDDGGSGSRQPAGVLVTVDLIARLDPQAARRMAGR